jgi:hypothetical protein
MCEAPFLGMKGGYPTPGVFCERVRNKLKLKKFIFRREQKSEVMSCNDNPSCFLALNFHFLTAEAPLTGDFGSRSGGRVGRKGRGERSERRAPGSHGPPSCWAGGKKKGRPPSRMAGGK